MKGVFQSLLLLGVLVLSTMFVSSMNSSSTTLFNMRFNEDMEHGYCMMQNHTLSHHRDQEIQMGPMEVVDKRASEKGDMVEVMLVKKHESAVDSTYQDEETQLMDVIEEENFEEIEHTDELKEDTFLESGETDAVEVAEGENKAKVEGCGEVVEPQIRDIEETSYLGLLEPAEDYQTPLFSEEQSGIVVNPVEEILNEKASEEDVIGSITEEVGNSKDVTDEVVMSKKVVTDTKVNDDNLKPKETEFLYQVLVGVLIFSTVILSLLVGFRLRRKPCSEPLLVKEEKVIRKDSTPLPSKPYCETWIEEKCISVPFSSGDEHSDAVNSFGRNFQSSIHSTDKDREEYSGEFVVREIRRPSGVKNRTTEVEVSNYSVSSEKTLGGKSHSVSIQAQPAHSEFSVMDSPSRGSYTAKKEVNFL